MMNCPDPGPATGPRPRRVLRNSRALALAFALAAALAAAAMASDIAATVDLRQERFDTMGRAMKVFRAQLKGNRPVPRADLVAAASAIATTAPDIAGWFPAGSGPESGLETDALAYIWRNEAKFERLAGELGPVADALVVAVESGDDAAIGRAARGVAGACRDCHRSFRAD